ncbi:protein kinase [Pendulispora rubella]|uniref:Protein kinase n=1 Tax=Pendulispora rubella TaxID=2741070 RepID=A0ABZ2LIQ0_9BACT
MSSRSSTSQRAFARIGTVVHQCRIDRLIGIGGTAVVYAATRDDGQRVAIKFLLERFHDDAHMVRLFSQEANVANQVPHRAAVPVLDCSVDESGCAFLIMPLLEGETVRSRWEYGGHRMPLADVGVIVSDTLDVLESAHAIGIVHRDIKPDNLFIVADGEVRVLDFGIARRTGRDGSATLTGHTIGSPAFMSPEQALGDRHAVGPASDIWSAGATMFTLLSGQFVHESESGAGQLAAAATRQARSLGDVASDLAPSIVRFVDKALSSDPKDRWPSARAMRAALHASLEGAVNEPMEAITARVRAKFAMDLAQRTEPIHAKQPRQELKSRSKSPPRPWMRFVHPDIEVKAYLPKFFGAMTATANRILADHGLGEFADTGWFIPDTRPWWPMEPYILVIHALMAAVGPIKAVDTGKQKAQHVPLPPDLDVHEIHGMMRAIDAAYHLNHRQNGEAMLDIRSGRMVDIIGHYTYRGRLDTENSIVMECENPYPCDLDQGILLGFARRFEARAVVEHAPGPCRREGAESCVYHVTWW